MHTFIKLARQVEGMYVGWGFPKDPQEGINTTPQHGSIAVPTGPLGELLPFLLARVSRRDGSARVGAGRQAGSTLQTLLPTSTSRLRPVLRRAVEMLVKNAQFPTWPHLR